MNGESNTKIAMSNHDKNKLLRYLKIGLGAGIPIAAIGAIASKVNANKKRKKDLDTEYASNSITVPVSKSTLLGDIPTPEEFAKGSVPASGSAKKVDFFSAPKTASDEGGGDDVGKPETSEKKEVSAETDEDGNLVLRDQLGRFVSPTDPVAVIQEEKTAEGFWDMVSHPVRSAKALWHEGTFRPIALAAGGGAAVIVATKIIDAINKKRRAEAKKSMEKNREAYAKMVFDEGSEKTANSRRVGDNLAYDASAILGGSFIFPALITAVVVRRMMKQKSEEKKREREAMSTTPQTPSVFFKVAEDEVIETTPESLLALFLVKRAMFLEFEREDRGLVEKKAGMSDVQAIDRIIGVLEDPANAQDLMEVSRSYTSGRPDDAKPHFMNMFTRYKGPDKANLAMMAAKPQIQRSVLRHPRTAKLFTTRYTDPKWEHIYGAHKDDMLGDEIAKNFKRDSFLYNIVKWFYKTFGIGSGNIKSRIGDMLEQTASRIK